MLTALLLKSTLNCCPGFSQQCRIITPAAQLQPRHSLQYLHRQKLFQLALLYHLYPSRQSLEFPPAPQGLPNHLHGSLVMDSGRLPWSTPAVGRNAEEQTTNVQEMDCQTYSFGARLGFGWLSASFISPLPFGLSLAIVER